MSQAFLIFKAVVAAERPEKTKKIFESYFLRKGRMLTEEKLSQYGCWKTLATQVRVVGDNLRLPKKDLVV